MVRFESRRERTRGRESKSRDLFTCYICVCTCIYVCTDDDDDNDDPACNRVVLSRVIGKRRGGNMYSGQIENSTRR